MHSCFVLSPFYFLSCRNQTFSAAAVLPSTLYWVPNHFSRRWHCPSLAADSNTRLALWGLSWFRASAMICKFQTIFHFKCSSDCLTQQRLLSWNVGRTRHTKLTKQICFVNTTSVSINTKPVPPLYVITNACITQYAYFLYIKTYNQSSKNIYLRPVFKQELVSCQKILLLKQLHVLTKIFYIVNWICLQAKK